MSLSIKSDVILYDVFVDHPYEPCLCKQQKADILVFRHNCYGSVYDVAHPILSYKYGSITIDELQNFYGIYVLPLFHDISLRKSTFDICKEYFKRFSSLYEYEYYYTKYVVCYKKLKEE